MWLSTEHLPWRPASRETPRVLRAKPSHGAWDLNRGVGWGEGGEQLTSPEPSPARCAGGLGFQEGSSLREEGTQDRVCWGDTEYSRSRVKGGASLPQPSLSRFDCMAAFGVCCFCLRFSEDINDQVVEALVDKEWRVERASRGTEFSPQMAVSENTRPGIQYSKATPWAWKCILA